VSFSESPNINQQTAQIIRFLKILAWHILFCTYVPT
jgi:hypothetical protein